MVNSVQRVFDRLDVSFKGKVKLKSVIEALEATGQYDKLLENYKRYAGSIHPCLSIAVTWYSTSYRSIRKEDSEATFRDVLNALFSKSHPRQMKASLFA